MYTILGKPTKMDHSRPLFPLFLPFLHIWWLTKIFLPMVGLEPWISLRCWCWWQPLPSSLIEVSDHICFQKWEKRLNLFLHFSQKERNPENVEHLFDLNICQRWPTFGQKTDTLCCWLVKKSWKKNFDAKWNNWFYDRIIYFPFISCSEILYNSHPEKIKVNWSKNTGEWKQLF